MIDKKIWNPSAHSSEENQSFPWSPASISFNIMLLDNSTTTTTTTPSQQNREGEQNKKKKPKRKLRKECFLYTPMYWVWFRSGFFKINFQTISNKTMHIIIRKCIHAYVGTWNQFKFPAHQNTCIYKNSNTIGTSHVD